MSGRRTLQDSKWATRPRARLSGTDPQTYTNPEKLQRLLSRIRWKAETLLYSWARATADPGTISVNSQYANSIVAATRALSNGSNAIIEPTTMFKLDFFEFYVLLERYIVLCLSVCDVIVPRGSAVPEPNANQTLGTHRFHANLLDTLEKEDCIFNEALGKGETRRYLGIAKEYRNRWKDADEMNRVEDYNHKEGPNALNLPTVLKCLLEGLEKAKTVAEARLTNIPNGTRRNTETIQAMVDYMDLDDGPFEAVDDGMDIEWEL